MWGLSEPNLPIDLIRHHAEAYSRYMIPKLYQEHGTIESCRYCLSPLLRPSHSKSRNTKHAESAAACQESSPRWKFPKSTGPKTTTPKSRAAITRTPTKRTPKSQKLPDTLHVLKLGSAATYRGIKQACDPEGPKYRILSSSGVPLGNRNSLWFWVDGFRVEGLPYWES